MANAKTSIKISTGESQTRWIDDNQSDPSKVAELIFNMKFGDLVNMASQLYRMTHTGDDPELWDLSKESEWSLLLHSWAESYKDGSID
jgi:hypothetical protein